MTRYCLCPAFLWAAAWAAEVDDVRDVVRNYVAAEKAIARTEAGWRVERQTLQDLIRLAAQERDELAGRIGEFEETTTAAEQERLELLEEEARLESREEALAGRLQLIEPRLHALRARLPGPLQERLADLYRLLPGEQGTKAGVAQRMQVAIGILDAVQKFDRGSPEVHVEVRDDGQGGKAAVKSVYLGLGVGYYLRESDGDAGVLRPGPEGWISVSRRDLAGAIRKVIEVAEGQTQAAEFVPLPVEAVE